MALFDRKSTLGAALAVAASAGLAAAPGYAQDQAQMEQASVTTQQLGPACEGAQLSRDASRTAFEYARDNDAFAIAVFCGTESRVTNEQIEEILSREVGAEGVREVAFFYEQNDVPVTTVEFSYAGASDGPFTLGQSRPEARSSARQFAFKKGLLPELALRE